MIVEDSRALQARDDMTRDGSVAPFLSADSTFGVKEYPLINATVKINPRNGWLLVAPMNDDVANEFIKVARAPMGCIAGQVLRSGASDIKPGEIVYYQRGMVFSIALMVKFPEDGRTQNLAFDQMESKYVTGVFPEEGYGVVEWKEWTPDKLKNEVAKARAAADQEAMRQALSSETNARRDLGMLG